MELIQLNGILGLIHLILFVIALVNILGSNMSAGNKLLWALIVLLLPVVGLIIYYVFGPKA